MDKLRAYMKNLSDPTIWVGGKYRQYVSRFTSPPSKTEYVIEICSYKY
jgi:hypothetical protein